MSSHQWFEENRAAYVAGGLDEQERRSFADHLSRCDECSREVASIEQELAWLPLGVEPIPPRPGFKRQVIETVLHPRRRWDRWVYPLAAAASLVLAVGVWASARAERADLIAQVERSERTLATFQRAQVIHQASITSDGVKASAGLVIFDSPETGHCNVVVHGLPPAPDGQVYRFWFLTEDGELQGIELPVATDSPIYVTLDRPDGKVTGASLTVESMEEAGAKPAGVELAHVVF
jgi:anti-sigma-K factor RskA